MPFTDRAQIHVEGGHGGNGALSFRREAHVPRGGPDGGNGGRGGHVLLRGEAAIADLSRFRNEVHHRAQAGAGGEGRRRKGRDGDDLVVAVPIGTRVLRDGDEIARITEHGQLVDVAQGGRGGVGNRAFRSSTHRAPRETVPGTPGEAAWLTLELRLPVAVAIVGLPNSGKSSLLNALTGARTPVADYPHTTTEPGLGNIEDDGARQYLVVDLPGVGADGEPRRESYLPQLEGAHILLHCVDADDPEAWEARVERVREAIEPFRAPEAEEIIVVTKADRSDAGPPGAPRVSVLDGTGIEELRSVLIGRLAPEGR